MAERKGLLQAPPLLGHSAKAASLKMRGCHLVRKTSSCVQGSQTMKAMGPMGLPHGLLWMGALGEDVCH